MLPIILRLQYLGKVGTVYVSEDLLDYAGEKILVGGPPEQRARIQTLTRLPLSDNPVIFSSSGDLKNWTLKEMRPRFRILMEHGVGITPAPNHQSYAGGKGAREFANFFLAPNQHIYNLSKQSLPHVKQAIIGTPYMDRWRDFDFNKYKLMFPGTSQNIKATISFHFDANAAPEAGTALNHYDGICLNQLGSHSEFRIMGHSHPRAKERMKSIYANAKIPYIDNFEFVMNISDLYVCDTSSTIYEFAATNRPVLFLNAPWFRKNVHTGIRFWEYTDIGPQCNEPEDLPDKIIEAYETRNNYAEQRMKMREELYPYWGTSVERTIEVLEAL